MPLAADEPLRAATQAVIDIPPAVVIANTGIGIRSWFGAAESWDAGPDLRESLAGARIYARGPKASGAVHSAGLQVSARAGSELLSDVVDLVLADASANGGARGLRVVLQVDGSCDSPELDRLRAAGADVVAVPVYLWKLPEDRRPAVRLAEAIIAGKVHAVTFTSGPAIHNFVAIAEEAGIDEPLRRALVGGQVVVGCVGPVCAAALEATRTAGGDVVVPSAARLGPLVRAVTDRLASRSLKVDIGESRSVVVTGNVATVDGDAIALSGTDAKLLAALAGTPNVVFSKDRLLRLVWGPEARDTHVVEVAVARLRRRLGKHGKAVQSVHRRGYTLRT